MLINFIVVLKNQDYFKPFRKIDTTCFTNVSISFLDGTFFILNNSGISRGERSIPIKCVAAESGSEIENLHLKQFDTTQLHPAACLQKGILNSLRLIYLPDSYPNRGSVLPLFLIEDELKSGELLSIEGKYIKSNMIDIVVAQLQNNDSGAMTKLLWDNLTNASS